MSEKNMEKLVKEFLKQVKEKLPEWLKNNKKELRDILDELREHVWAKAEELSSSGQPTEDSIRMAIAHMGTPQSIAKEYKRRGTPKVYITKELWPFYTKVLGILVLVVVAINVVSIVLSFVFGGSFSLDLGGLYLGLAGVFILVTIIFVALSMEGYLPEDLMSKKDRVTDKELEKAERKGWPIHPKTGKPLKPFISPAGMLIGGIIQMAIGLVFMIQPNIEFLALMNPQFLFVIRLFGLFIIMEGTIDLCRAIIGNQQITTHQVLMVIKVLISLGSISILVILMNNPEIITIPYYTGNATGEFGVWTLPTSLVIPFKWLFSLLIVITVLSAIGDVYKAGKLEKYKINY